MDKLVIRGGNPLLGTYSRERGKKCRSALHGCGVAH